LRLADCSANPFEYALIDVAENIGSTYLRENKSTSQNSSEKSDDN